MSQNGNGVMVRVKRDAHGTCILLSGMASPLMLPITMTRSACNGTGVVTTRMLYMATDGEYTIPHSHDTNVDVGRNDSRFAQIVSSSLVRVRSLPCRNSMALDWTSHMLYPPDVKAARSFVWEDATLPCLMTVPDANAADGTYTCICTSGNVHSFEHLVCWQVCKGIAFTSFDRSATCNVSPSASNSASLATTTSLDNLSRNLSTVAGLYVPTALWHVMYADWRAKDMVRVQDTDVDVVDGASSMAGQMRCCDLARNAFFVWAMIVLGMGCGKTKHAWESDSKRTSARILKQTMNDLCGHTTLSGNCCLHNWGDRTDIAPHLPLLFLCRLMEGTCPDDDTFCILCNRHATTYMPIGILPLMWDILCETPVRKRIDVQRLFSPFVPSLLASRKDLLLTRIVDTGAVHLLEAFDTSLTWLMDVGHVQTESLVSFLRFVEGNAPLLVVHLTQHLQSAMAIHEYPPFISAVAVSSPLTAGMFVRILSIHARSELVRTNMHNLAFLRTLLSVCDETMEMTVDDRTQQRHVSVPAFIHAHPLSPICLL